MYSIYCGLVYFYGIFLVFVVCSTLICRTCCIDSIHLLSLFYLTAIIIFSNFVSIVLLGGCYSYFQAANFLNIKGLLDLTCKTVADMMTGKSLPEIRKMFHIINDYTPEEEEQVRKENQWAFEWWYYFYFYFLFFWESEWWYLIQW